MSSSVSVVLLELKRNLIAHTYNPDTIWNHMSGAESGQGVAGSSFTHYVYPGTYQSQVRREGLQSQLGV